MPLPTNPSAEKKIMLGAIILGAGRSTRMGRPKLLLPWGATSVVGHLIDQWQRLNANQIVVVCAADDTALRAELASRGLPVEQQILNPNPELGMFSSIQCTARWAGWNPQLTHWAVVLGDQPHLKAETLQQVLACSAAHPDDVCQPRHGGHGRHPVLLPRIVFDQLANTAAPDLKNFLHGSAARITRCDINDPGLDLDIDRPEDYAAARRLCP